MPRANLPVSGDNLYTEKVKRIQKLTSETEAKIDWIPGVVNDASSTSTTDALSANMGKVLQDQINELKSMWRFLSTWNCTTGLPTTDPIDDPYDYKIWDYYIVSTTGATNYRPTWDHYVAWVASTVVETAIVNINDWYLFDWQYWVLQNQNPITLTIDTQLSTSSTNAVENRAIATAINTKQNVISDLATIRANASAWAWATQPWDNISTLTNDVGYQTSWDVASAISGKANTADLATVAFTWDAADLINFPTPATVNNATITIQKNGTDVDSFTVNQATNKSINIAVPTKTSDLNNDSGFITSASIPTKTSDLNNDSGFITSSYVGNGQVSFTQGWTNKWSFTLNQAWAANVALDWVTVISQAEYSQITPDNNTTYFITDGTPASQAGFVTYPTTAEMNTAINTAVAWVVSDVALDSTWDWDTTHAPSKNVTYDAIWDVQTLLANI